VSHDSTPIRGRRGLNRLFWWENLKQTTLEDLHVGVNESIMLKLTFKNRVEGVDKIHLAQNRDQSQASVKAVMNLQLRCKPSPMASHYRCCYKAS
jgi:hypothetical protein